MLRLLVEFSIRFRGVVVALACVVAGYGLYTTAHAKFDVYPEFAPPQVVVQTEAPGLSAEEVEELVTRPVENAVNGTPNLESMRSQSIQGLSVITILFDEKTDVFRARQMIGERLAEAAQQLPQGVEIPGMAPLTGATSLALVIGITSEKRSPMELRTFAAWTMRPRLLAVPGVASVTVFGGEVKQLQIQVTPVRLAAHGLSLNDVLNAARKATGIRGAGFVETPAQRIVIRTLGQSLQPDELGEAIVSHHNGAPVRLKDVARVTEAAEPKIGDGAVDGKPGVLLLVSSQYGSNTLEVTAAIERALEEMKPAVTAEGIDVHPGLFRPASFIEAAVHNVNSSLILGGVLVSIVLFIFLFNFRTGFISLTAIPLSLLIAVIALDRMGISLNTMTLGGLAIAIGVVVDDAIIDVENIYRRLRENAQLPSPRSAALVVLEASLEVRSAVVYATFVVVLVFLPVLAMSGIQGRLFAPLGIANVLAILASLAVALTVTPALCFLMLRRQAERAHEPRILTGAKRLYESLLMGITRRPKTVMAGALVLCVAAAALIPFFGGAFLPEMREGHFIVHMAAVPGTSLQESLRIGAQVSNELLKSPNVVSTAQQIGRAEKAEDTWGTHYTEIHVRLKPLSGDAAETVESEIRQILQKFPGVSFAIRPFLTERIEEIIAGVTAQVVIKIFGDDLDAIDAKSREIAQVVAGIRGAADVQVESPSGAPQIVVQLRADRLKQLGFRPVDVLEGVQTAYQGAAVAQTYEANRVFDVTVILDPEVRQNPEAVGDLILENDQGARVPLRELAEVYPTTGRYMILHDGSRRRQAVTCNVRGRDLSSFVEEARRVVTSKVRFEQGIYPVFGGADAARAQAQSEILLYSIIAGVCILTLLSIVFRTVRNLALVLVNLPFALVGGVLAVFFTGGYLTVGSMVGFVTLFGITTRNSIMMISHFEHLVTEEGMTWGPDAAIRGAVERLAPVLMTALVTGLGLLPLALGSGDPGREIEGPMAIVILGGLVTSTALNLLVLPTLALRYGRFVHSTPEVL
jgi:CzcA family heavy metal efflux pump